MDVRQNLSMVTLSSRAVGVGTKVTPSTTFVFSVTLQPILLKIKRQVQGLRANVSFFDNINKVGNKNALQHVMSILDKECPAIGLTL